MYSWASNVAEKYVCSLCGETVKFHWRKFAWKHTDHQDTLKHAFTPKPLQSGE